MRLHGSGGAVARRPLPLSLVLSLLLALVGSALRATPAVGAAAAGMPIIDDEGRALSLAAPARRIVSLAPGATAMLFEAGAGQRIVGTSDYSNEPEAARRIERIGDAQSFDLERVLGLHPDVVVVWSGGNPATQIARLERIRLPVYRHRIRRLADIPDSIRRFGVLAGTESVAAAAADELEVRLAELERRHAGARAGSILIQVWDHPIYTVGRSELMSDVVAICGYRNVYADLADPGPAVSLESVLARDPDVILAVAPDRALADEWIRGWRSYPMLKAVRRARLIPWTDQRLSRLGPSMIDATEALCDALATGMRAPAPQH